MGNRMEQSSFGSSHRSDSRGSTDLSLFGFLRWKSGGRMFLPHTLRPSGLRPRGPTGTQLWGLFTRRPRAGFRRSFAPGITLSPESDGSALQPEIEIAGLSPAPLIYFAGRQRVSPHRRGLSRRLVSPKSPNSPHGLRRSSVVSSSSPGSSPPRRGGDPAFAGYRFSAIPGADTPRHLHPASCPSQTGVPGRRGLAGQAVCHANEGASSVPMTRANSERGIRYPS